MRGAGRKQVFHQANIVERLENLFSPGPACLNRNRNQTQRRILQKLGGADFRIEGDLHFLDAIDEIIAHVFYRLSKLRVAQAR